MLSLNVLRISTSKINITTQGISTGSMTGLIGIAKSASPLWRKLIMHLFMRECIHNIIILNLTIFLGIPILMTVFHILQWTSHMRRQRSGRICLC